MTLGAKKFDRYLLPVYLPLDLVAGVGLLSAAAWIRRRWPEGAFTRVFVPMLLWTAILAQAAWTVSSYPYYF
jgi:hypothetical protein